MRWSGVVVAAFLLAGCAGGLAERQAELQHWIGRSEAQLVDAMGAPNRVYDSGDTKVLTYEDVYLREGPAGPYYFGPGPAGPTGFGGTVYRTVCDTTYIIGDEVVKGFSLRGMAVGDAGMSQASRGRPAMGDLHEDDILLWSKRQAALLHPLAAGEHVNDRDLDWANLGEEIEAVGRGNYGPSNRCWPRRFCIA
jgi:hypothetical protein